MLLVLVPENTVMVSTNAGRSCSQCFWKKRCAADAVGHADHGERAVGQMRQDVRRHLREVAQQVALGERGLLAAPDPRASRRDRGASSLMRCAPTASVNAVLAFSSCATTSSTGCRADSGVRRCGGAAARAARFGAAHRLRIDVVAQPQEHRRAQIAVVGPALEAHLGDELRARPRSSAPFSSGSRRTGRCSRCSGSRRVFTCASERSSKPEPTCEA